MAKYTSKICQHCGTTFTAERKHAKYCGDSCRNLASQNRKKDPEYECQVELSGTTNNMNNMNTTQDSIYQFMFEQKKEELEKLRKEYEEEKTARKEAEKQNFEHEKEHIRKDNLIEKLNEDQEEAASKKGLGGLLDDPTKLENLGNAVAPILAALAAGKGQQTNDALPPLQGVQLRNQHNAAEYGNFLEQSQDPEQIHQFLNKVAYVYKKANPEIFTELENYINSKYYEEDVRRQASQ